MRIFKQQKNKGFTLIETLVAVFILLLATTSLIGVIASNLFTARYANNDIIVNYLIQEAVEYIRNDRDTIAFQQRDSGGGWANFINKYNSAGCLSSNGCTIEPLSITPIVACSSTCPNLKYYPNADGPNKNFYTYAGTNAPSNFKRKVVINDPGDPIQNQTDEIDIKIVVEWYNGTALRSRTFRTSLLNWNK